jgi:hypothetical protein
MSIVGPPFVDVRAAGNEDRKLDLQTRSTGRPKNYSKGAKMSAGPSMMDSQLSGTLAGLGLRGPNTRPNQRRISVVLHNLTAPSFSAFVSPGVLRIHRVSTRNRKRSPTPAPTHPASLPAREDRSFLFVRLLSSAILCSSLPIFTVLAIIMQRSNSMLFANFNQDFTCVTARFLEMCSPDTFS